MLEQSHAGKLAAIGFEGNSERTSKRLRRSQPMNATAKSCAKFGRNWVKKFLNENTLVPLSIIVRSYSFSVIRESMFKKTRSLEKNCVVLC